MSPDIYSSGKYLDDNPSWHAEHSLWKAQCIKRMMDKHKILPDTLCEVGCGAGEILRQLQGLLPSSCRLTGYEISPQALKICQTKANQRLQFKKIDFQFEHKEFYDVVMVIDTVEHVQDYFKFLRLTRIRGQYKIFHFPLDLSVQTVWRVKPLLNARSKVGHLHYFNKELALTALRDCGYKIIDYFYTDSRVRFPEGSIYSNVLKYLRKMLFKFAPDLTVRILGGYSLLILST